MNYYRRFIADYATKTRHLSMLQTGAYDLLLDAYYASEKPLPKDREKLYRICKAFSVEEMAAVEEILVQFFKDSVNGFVNKRAKQEISAAQSAIKAARENGKKGGRPKTQKKPGGFTKHNPDETQPLTHKNHPLTSIPDPPPSNPTFSQDSSMVVVEKEPLKNGWVDQEVERKKAFNESRKQVFPRGT